MLNEVITITQSVVALAIANNYTNAVDKNTLEEVMLSKVPKKVHEANNRITSYNVCYTKLLRTAIHLHYLKMVLKG